MLLLLVVGIVLGILAVVKGKALLALVEAKLNPAPAAVAEAVVAVAPVAVPAAVVVPKE